MRLVDLAPRWFDVPGLGTDKDGITFICPCATCCSAPRELGFGQGGPARLGVQFANPIGSDPKPLMDWEQKLRHTELATFDVPPGYLWRREGDTFETLTLIPSVDASKSGHWHGFVRNGGIE
jgi:hypothetical protein